MNKNIYDVIIIGAGPSGISTALNLHKEGIKNILIIEKYKFPRYKCCAGYITKRTASEFKKYGLNIKKCNYSFIKNFNIYYKLKNKQNINNEFLYTNKNIDRVELDYNFYMIAKSKKIRILENSKIIKHDLNKKCVILSNNNKYYYNKIVFADGTNSIGNKYLNKDYKKNIAMQITFKSDNENEVQIHFGITKHGYGWVSSYNGITNVGLTDIYNSKLNYNKIFKEFIHKLNFKVDMKELKGAFTPLGIRKGVIGDMYYVGDALGACDPLTLSGLRYGLQSGKKCAESIKKNNKKIYIKFVNKLKYKFKIMAILQKIFYFKPILVLVFEIGCRLFNKLISYVFNNFFVNKK